MYRRLLTAVIFLLAGCGDQTSFYVKSIVPGYGPYTNSQMVDNLRRDANTGAYIPECCVIKDDPDPTKRSCFAENQYDHLGVVTFENDRPRDPGNPNSTDDTNPMDNLETVTRYDIDLVPTSGGPALPRRTGFMSLAVQPETTVDTTIVLVDLAQKYVFETSGVVVNQPYSARITFKTQSGLKIHAAVPLNFGWYSSCGDKPWAYCLAYCP